MLGCDADANAPSIAHRQLKHRAVSVLLAIGLVLGQTGQNVTLPIFADGIGGAGGTPYFVVWFASLSFVVILGTVLIVLLIAGVLDKSQAAMWSLRAQSGPFWIGLCDALNGMMVVFASPSSRTPPYLQGVLGLATIPLTVVVRVGLLRKFPSRLQGLAAGLVVAGLATSLIPTMFFGQGPALASIGWFWPVWFILGFIPAAFMNVIEEKVLKDEHKTANMIVFVFWLNFWQLVFVTALFWLDIVPGYGMSNDLEDWVSHMQAGIACFFFSEDCEGVVFLWGLLFILSYVGAYLFGGLLLRHTGGAVWQAVVTSTVSPISTLWWALFQPKPHFHWEPNWGPNMTFAVLGLFLISPGVALYSFQRRPRNQGEEVTQPLSS